MGFPPRREEAGDEFRLGLVCATRVPIFTSGPSAYWGLILRAVQRDWLTACPAPPAMHERHPAHVAEALTRRVSLLAGRTDDQLPLHQRTSSATSRTWPFSIRYERTSGSASADSPTMTHSTPGQLAAKLMSVCEGYGALRTCEW